MSYNPRDNVREEARQRWQHELPITSSIQTAAGRTNFYHGSYEGSWIAQQDVYSHAYQHTMPAEPYEHYYPEQTRSHQQYHHSGEPVHSIQEMSYVDNMTYNWHSASPAVGWHEHYHHSYPIGYNDREKPAVTEEQTSSVSTEASYKPRRRKTKPSTKGIRFVWTEDLHRIFVNAIFTTGLRSALPDDIIRLIQGSKQHDSVTETAVGCKLRQYRTKQPELGKMLQKVVTKSEQATKKRRLNDESLEAKPNEAQAAAEKRPDSVKTHCFLTLPKLTEVEENSPLGLSLGSLLHTLKALEGQLHRQRAACRPGISSQTPACPTKQENMVVATDGPVSNSAGGDQTTQHIVAVDNCARSLSMGVSPPGRESSLSNSETIDIGSFGSGLEDDEKMFSYLNNL